MLKMFRLCNVASEINSLDFNPRNMERHYGTYNIIEKLLSC